MRSVKLYMAVTDDEYELPLCVGDINEVAAYSGVKPDVIRTLISRPTSGKKKGMRFRSVDVDMDGEEWRTKIDTVLNHLQTKGGLTAPEAEKLYGVSNLVCVIYRLRQRGYNITHQTVIAEGRNGKPRKVMEYRLKRGEDR